MDDAARLAALARAAADLVLPGMLLGLGTGSTASAFVRELGRRVAEGLTVTGIATSAETERLAREHAIPLVTLDEVERLDLGIDGADEIDPGLNLIKGRGGALLHEKLVALACDEFLVIAAAEKKVPALGTRFPLPVEIVPFGWRQTATRLASLDLRPTLRRSDGSGASAPFVSDGGHLVLDCGLTPGADVAALARSIKGTTGVVEHGFFLGVARRALLAEADGAIRLLSADGGADG